LTRPGHKRIGDYLLEAGALTEDELEEALEIQRRTGERLGRVLVKLGHVSESSIATVIERQLGIPRVSLAEYVVADDVIKIVPENMARRYKVLAVERDGNKLTLAMADPLNVLAIDDIKLATGFEVSPVVAPEDEIVRALDQYYGSSEDLDEVVRYLEKYSEDAIRFASYEEEIGVDRLRELVDEAPVVRLVNMIIAQAVGERASDIHVEPHATGVRVRYRVDGILREVMDLPRGSHAAIASRFKIMSNMDIAERRVPQDGRVQLKVEGEEIDLRVSTLPTIYGEKVVCRVLFRRGAMVKLENEIENSLRLRKPARAHIATGQPARLGPDESIAQRRKGLYIPLDDGVCVHARIHGRRYHPGGARGHDRRSKQVISYPRCDLPDEVGRCRSHHENISGFRKGYVLHVPLARLGKHVYAYRIGCERPEGERRNKLARCLRHDHMYIKPLLDQHACKKRSFGRRYPSGHPQHTRASHGRSHS
jgi:hypothetical protein